MRPVWVLAWVTSLLLLSSRLGSVHSKEAASAGRRLQADSMQDRVARYGRLLQRLQVYKPELPPSILSKSIGMQGDLRRLQRTLLKLIHGEPVTIALLGGSISMRGYNHEDEAYISQVHKWLEVTLLEGCREEALRTANISATNADGSQDSSQAEADGNVVASGRKLVSSTKKAEGSSRKTSSMSLGRDDGERDDKEAQQAAPVRVTTASSTAHRTLVSSVDALDSRLQASASAGRGRALLNDIFALDPPATDPATDIHVHTHPGYLATQHMCGGSTIKMLNLAVPAAGPGYAERCALQRLPQDVDLVFMDFGCNDYHDARYFNHPERHAFERIVRYVLSREKRPALVLFEAFSWSQSGGDFYGGGKRGGLGQDKHTIMAEYYGEVQVLSVRAALWQILNATTDSKRLIYVPNFDPVTISDFLHVALLGHRWYADIIIHYLQSQLKLLLAKLLALEALFGTGVAGAIEGTSGGEDSGGGVAELLLGPAPDGVTSRAAGAAAAAQTGTGTDPHEPPGNMAWCSIPGNRGVSFPVACPATPPFHTLPPPFFPGNEVHNLGLCAVGEELEALVQAAGPHPGWEWVDEGKRGTHKWGFVTTQIGAELSISVPLDPTLLQTAQAAVQAAVPPAKAGAKPAPPPHMLAWIIYLESYEGMGMATVTCGGSCHCSPFNINAHNPAHQSVSSLKSFKIYPTGAAGATGGRALHGEAAIADGQVSEASESGLSSSGPSGGGRQGVASIGRMLQNGGSSGCEVHVRLLPNSTDPASGHKFKVIGLTTSATSIWHIDEIFKTGVDPMLG